MPTVPNMVILLMLTALLLLLIKIDDIRQVSRIQEYLSQRIIRPSSFMIQVYREQAEERSTVIKEYRQNNISDYLDFYNVIVPEVFCSEMVRLGTVGDGGKWICSPQNLPSNCSILSLGLSNAISFDIHLQKVTEKRCRLFGYDTDDQLAWIKRELAKWNASSEKAKIGAISNGGTPIENLLQRHSIQQVEILKIDIEGGEFTALLPFLQKFKVAQILIEIHGPKKAYAMANLLAKIAKLGYWIAAYEINGRFHDMCEFLLVHESSFKRYEATPLARYLI